MKNQKVPDGYVGHCMFRIERPKLWAIELGDRQQHQGACENGNSQAPPRTYGIHSSRDEAGNLCSHRSVHPFKVGKHCPGVSTVVMSSRGTGGNPYIVVKYILFSSKSLQ